MSNENKHLQGLAFKPGYDERRKGNGRKKTGQIRKLMREFASVLAPEDLRNNQVIAEFLKQFNCTGTIEEVLVARIYGLALYGGDIQAIKLITDMLSKEGNSGNSEKIVINFITPVPEAVETEELASDKWNPVADIEEAEREENDSTTSQS